jgi:hypothetical protein
MQAIRTRRVIRAGVAALVTVLVAPRAKAAIVATQSYTVTLDTGLRGFVTDFPTQTVDSNGAIIGSTVSDTSNRTTVPAFDQRYGAFQNMGGIVAFYGYPFEATFTVEGATDTIGDKVVAHEDVAGTIQMFVNGAPVASEPFNVSLNPSCTASSNSFTVIVCSDEEKQGLFSSNVPVAIQPKDVINFQYSLAETNISCEVTPSGGGAPFACIQGNTGITDLNNIKDPEWGGTLAVTFDYVPEPASLSVLGIGLAGLIGVRRKRRAE